MSYRPVPTQLPIHPMLFLLYFLHCLGSSMRSYTGRDEALLLCWLVIAFLLCSPQHPGLVWPGRLFNTSSAASSRRCSHAMPARISLHRRSCGGFAEASFQAASAAPIQCLLLPRCIGGLVEARLQATPALRCSHAMPANISLHRRSCGGSPPSNLSLLPCNAC